MKKFLGIAKKVVGLSLVASIFVVGAGFELYRGDVAITPSTQSMFVAMDQAESLGPVVSEELMKTGHYKVGKSYNIKGVKYTPEANFNYAEEGLASWYGPGFHGKKTANGETYDMYTISAAHKTLQMPSIVKVTNLDNGRELIVRVNDRGPYHKDNRIIDLSYAAAQKLGFDQKGVARVRVEAVKEASIALAAACQGKTVGALQKELRCDAGGIKLAENTHKSTFSS